eukprot:TRINITY_DN8709_c0_g1_i1.p1 TRINITY_DN8709_c0_g1~~TRINITY_DN8709_c0_g1_i1.p1  ORF type:complete len:327 (+),score=18.89 TRINITY_DN8709_c0_g1_i1:105-1085(+)
MSEIRDVASTRSQATVAVKTQQPSAGTQPSGTFIPTDAADASSDPVVFECRTENVKIICNILSALHKASHSKKDTGKDAHSQVATVIITSTGVKFTVEEAKSFQGNAFLQEELFSTYRLTSAHEQFQINFDIFTDCLSIFGASAGLGASPACGSMELTYGGYGTKLAMGLQDEGVFTNCAIQTMDCDDPTNFSFRSHPVANKVIVEACHLRDAFNELDWSSPKLSILLSPDAPYFRLTTIGDAGSCQVDYPKDSEFFEEFSCGKPQMFSYRTAHLQLAVRGLQIAQKTQIRMNEIGVLSMQHMIKNEDKSISFVDYFVAPQDEEDD